VDLLSPTELAHELAQADGDSDILWVDLDERADPHTLQAAVQALERARRPAIGILGDREPAPSLLDALTTTLTTALASRPTTDRRIVHVPDLDAAATRLTQGTAAHPQAACTLVDLLRITAELPAPAGVTAESLAYSMLLGGTEFGAWRKSRPIRPHVAEVGEPVLVERQGDTLTVTLSRPRRHNAFSRELRDGFNEALEVARLDPGVSVELRGDGPSFCSGGDLDEFGTARDLVEAHLVRLRQSAGLRVHALAARTTAHLHGACIGAGIEVPAFAGTVTAGADTRIQLPELSMGLVPGAGGTVSVTKRIGRWRTAYLVLSGDVIGPEEALSWGLVDAVLGSGAGVDTDP
jgi:enoyl-CoA hydratase/carnithine racemase